jgi:hypothetical protein
MSDKYGREFNKKTGALLKGELGGRLRNVTFAVLCAELHLQNTHASNFYDLYHVPEICHMSNNRDSDHLMQHESPKSLEKGCETQRV